jgi:hypothetical protein
MSISISKYCRGPSVRSQLLARPQDGLCTCIKLLGTVWHTEALLVAVVLRTTVICRHPGPEQRSEPGLHNPCPWAYSHPGVLQ